jgi:hypothetical protein
MIDLYVSLAKMQLCFYAHKHTVGNDATSNIRLLENLGVILMWGLSSHKNKHCWCNYSFNECDASQSNFDYNGNVYKVTSVNPKIQFDIQFMGPRQDKGMRLHSTESSADQ